RPEFAAASLRHLWGVVLPPPDRPRPVPTARRHYTGALKLHAEAEQHRGLRHTVECAMRLIPSTRLVTVMTRQATITSAEDFASLPGHHCIAPSSRGSAPEVFLAALSVLPHDPHAIVAALPAVHLSEHAPRLLHYVARAAAAVYVRPDLP